MNREREHVEAAKLELEQKDVPQLAALRGRVERSQLLPLLPGDLLHFQRELPGATVRSKAGFIGIKGKQYLITEPPLLATGPMFNANGIECVVRFLVDGVVYGFTTTVRHLIYKPVAMVLYDLPRQIENLNLRHQERYRVNLPTWVTYQSQGDGQKAEVTMMDLSADGCRLRSSVFIEVDEEIDVCFPVGDDEKNPLLQAQVRNLKQDRDGYYLVGVKFLAQDDMVFIYIEQILKILGR